MRDCVPVRTGIAGLCLAALLLVPACGGDEEPSPQAQETTTQEDRPAPKPSKPQVASCIPAQRDDGDLGLQQTRLRSTGSGDLEVTWTTKKPMPTGPESVLYSVSAFNQADERYYQLGVKFLSGSQIAFFVFDFEEAYNYELGLAASVSGSRVQAVFPKDHVDKLGIPFRWYSAYSIEARDDYCPDDAVSASGFKTLRFPGL